MIDSHTHLYFDWYDEDREAVISRMIDAGVRAAISVAVDLESSHLVKKQMERYPFFYGAFGIHPNDCKNADSGDIAKIEKILRGNSKAVAVGEVGLDFYRDHASPRAQREMFVNMIDLAKRTKKPLIIHNREADNEVYEILKKENAGEMGGVFHCFGGDVEMAKKVLDLNFHISFTGNVTFKNFRQRDVVEYIPLEKLLLETDSPFLTPVPHRGKRNEPAYLINVAEGLSAIKKVPLQEIIDRTTENTKKLFKISF